MNNKINAEEYLTFVHFIVRKYHMKHANYIYSSYDDVYQLGVVGLMNAIKKFDSNLGYDFTTFARYYISGEILKFFRDDSQIIKFPRKIKKLVYKINHLNEPTIQEIIECTGCNKEDALLVINYIESKKILSINSPVPGTDGALVEDIIGEDDSDYKTNFYLNDFIETLNENEKIVVKMKLEYKNQTEIAKALGTNQARISRMLKEIKQKLENYSGGKLCIM